MKPAMQFDARNLGILLGAAILVGALSAPWYVLDFSAARSAIGPQTAQLPGVLGDFARELVSALPDRITADGWTAFERNDIVLLFAALAAGLAALLDRHEVSTLIGVAAAGLIVVAMLSRPGGAPEGIISLSWGPWLALGGAALIVVASRLGESEPGPTPEVDWNAISAQNAHNAWPAPADVVTPPPVLGDPASSVAPPR
jgi:hypothetical protein